MQVQLVLFVIFGKSERRPYLDSESDTESQPGEGSPAFLSFSFPQISTSFPTQLPHTPCQSSILDLWILCEHQNADHTHLQSYLIKITNKAKFSRQKNFEHHTKFDQEKKKNEEKGTKNDAKIYVRIDGGNSNCSFDNDGQKSDDNIIGAK